jgi:hypothetical protein
MSSHLVLPSHSKYLQTGYQHLSSSINHCLHHLRWFETFRPCTMSNNVKTSNEMSVRINTHGSKDCDVKILQSILRTWPKAPNISMAGRAGPPQLGQTCPHRMQCIQMHPVTQDKEVRDRGQRILTSDFWLSKSENLSTGPAGWFCPNPRAAQAALAGLPISGVLPIMWRKVCRRAWNSTAFQSAPKSTMRSDRSARTEYIPRKQNHLGISWNLKLWLISSGPQCSWAALPLTRPIRGTAEKGSLSFPAPHKERCCKTVNVRSDSDGKVTPCSTYVVCPNNWRYRIPIMASKTWKRII